MRYKYSDQDEVEDTVSKLSGEYDVLGALLLPHPSSNQTKVLEIVNILNNAISICERDPRGCIANILKARTMLMKLRLSIK